MMRAALLALLALAAPGALAQAKPQAPTEEATIQRFRAHAKPRKVTPAAPLGAEERNTIRRFREAKPSVVFVSAIAPVQDMQTLDITKVPTARGTGFVWDEWGHVVTNHHIITVEEGGKRLGEVKEVEVTLSNGKAYKGRVIGTSFAYDLSLIHI